MLVSKVNGQFTDFSANINLDRQELSKSTVDFTIKATSVNTGNERRDADLRSESFFLVDSFPDITFKSKQVVPGTADEFKLIGDLTIRGTTKEVTFDCTNNGFVETPRGDRTGFTATTKINRMDYGVKWDAALDNGGLVVSNEVVITVELELVKPKPEAKG
jgi:polyisoprenoid-binding protein YceI